MDFKNAGELLSICEEKDLKISEAMKLREIEEGETDEQTMPSRMEKAWHIMKHSALDAVAEPVMSMGGLIGGQAFQMAAQIQSDSTLTGELPGRAMMYAMAVLETNASMGLIVAAPTAGSAGVVPGVLLAMQETCDLTDAQVIDALFNAGAIGYLAMRNATVAGAVGGCQAEIGVAAAMAASAAVELKGGSPLQCLDAASTVLMNMLGLVCDPIGGLVESPCQSRNAAGAANALTAAQLSLAGIRQIIPFDEMLQVMYSVGRRIPVELRETALGGCAAAPSACSICGLVK